MLLFYTDNIPVISSEIISSDLRATPLLPMEQYLLSGWLFLVCFGVKFGMRIWIFQRVIFGKTFRFVYID
jgi:hypothetical protein